MSESQVGPDTPPPTAPRNRAAEADHAHVHVPPPVVHGLGILLGVGAAGLLPLRLPPSGWLTATGALLLAVAGILAGWGFREFQRSRNPVPPNRPVRALMTRGPFRFSRNPLYLALALLHGGMGLVLANGWVLLSLIPALLIVRYYVIAREEAYLRRRFGATYAAYAARVRRWL